MRAPSSSGPASVDSERRIRLLNPKTRRRLLKAEPGDQVLLLADPGNQTIEVYPIPVVARLLRARQPQGEVE